MTNPSSTQLAIINAASQAVRTGWSIESFIAHAKRAWMAALLDVRTEAEYEWRKVTEASDA